MKDSQQRQTISSGLRGNRGRYNLDSPPPAAHISYKPEMVGKQYGWVKIISAEKRWNEKWNRLLCAHRVQLMPFDSMDTPVKFDSGDFARLPELLGEPQTDSYVAGSPPNGSESPLRNPNDRNYPLYAGRGISSASHRSIKAGNLDHAECAKCMSGERVGSYRQQWALCTRKLRFVEENESGKSRVDGAIRMGSGILALLSKRGNTDAVLPERRGRRSSNRRRRLSA